jgi:hypothetical protein
VQVAVDGLERAFSNEKDHSKREGFSIPWANITAVLSGAAVVSFICSYIYVCGLSEGLHADLKSFPTVSDFVQLTPAWTSQIFAIFFGYMIIFVTVLIMLIRRFLREAGSLSSDIPLPCQVYWAGLFMTCFTVGAAFFRKSPTPIGQALLLPFFLFGVSIISTYFIRKNGLLPHLAVLTAVGFVALSVFAYGAGYFKVPGTSDPRTECVITATENRYFRGQILLQLSRDIFVLSPNGDIEAIPQSDVRQVTILHKTQVH